jgi:hypothetical protein
MSTPVTPAVAAASESASAEPTLLESLEARIASLEADVKVLLAKGEAVVKSDASVLETKVKAALAHIGVDVRKFF